jgi:rubrerythrin
VATEDALADSETFENLKAAFAADCQDVARFAWFATQADLEGEVNVAQLFRAASQGEVTHTQGHLDFLRKVSDPSTRLKVGKTVDNLRAAIARASYEAETMYRGFANTAREEGFDAVAAWFDTLATAEERQLELFKQALDGHQSSVT